MKTNKQLLLVASSLLAMTLVSCAGGGSTVDNDTEDTTNLKIMILNRGYGTTWLNKLAEKYESEHEGVTVSIEVTDSSDSLAQSLKGGKARNDYDLYFDVSELQTASLVNTYSSIDGGLYSLDELYATKVPGEEITYGEKMNATVKDELAIDGHYYSTSWAASTLGINYNETVLDSVLGAGNYTIPNTSDELVELGKKFVAAGEKNHFFLFMNGLDLVSRTLFLDWWAQYEGVENYNNFTNARYVDEATGRVYGNDVRIYTQQGRLEALKALEPLCRRDGDSLGYQYAATTASSLYKDIQRTFYDSSKGYALYPCGDWLEQESGIGSSSTVKMMKMPVVSSIINNLPKSTIKDDATLSKVVSAIDEGKTSYEGVANEDFARIEEARNISTSMANFHISYIPAYANAKKLAVDFLLNMATDENMKIYKENVKGGFLPFNTTYDESTFSTTEKSVAEVNKNAQYVFYSKKNPVFYLGGALHYTLASASGSSIESAMNVSSSTSNIYMTPEQYFNRFSEFYADGGWQNKVLSKLKL